MTDTPDVPFLPPGLQLGDDDVIEAFEEVEIPVEALDDGVDVDVDLGEVALDDAELDEEAEAAPPARVSGFDGIGTRREARERALALLYEA
ncbi:MAG: hypothetical protein ACTHN0_05955, partial [Aquihabitans sp.]